MDSDDLQPLLSSQDIGNTFTNSFKTTLKGQKYIKDRIIPRNKLSFNEIVEEKEIDSVVAVFVAAFDTHCGNIIEWSIPKDVDLKSIEFKALPSGAHTINFDFIYFRCKNLYGLGCYAKMKLQSDVERGARMKTVGILASTYKCLHRHMQFLETQVRHQLQTPGRYEPLDAFFNDHYAHLPSFTEQPKLAELDGITRSCRSAKTLPIMKITHPAGCFLQFINFFGANIFVLWKLVLLRKRILFFSPPPIGVVCYRVYCACCLGKLTLDGFESPTPRPYFYVNVADIDDIAGEESYIACTTENIFKEKQRLFDVYVDNQVVTSSDNHLAGLMKAGRSDHEKYNDLLNHKNDLLHQRATGVDNLPSEEAFYQSYFTQLNNEIFQTLTEISTGEDRTITNEHIRAMALDPTQDRAFIMDLLELYAIDALLVVDHPCCPV